MEVSKKSRPEWLERKLQNSLYYRMAERYYRYHPQTNSLYIELYRDGLVRSYDGWEYKKGLVMGKQGLKRAEFESETVDAENLKAEAASIILFVKRARSEFGWNVIPVFDGMEYILKS
jgi:hypothetical protein